MFGERTIIMSIAANSDCHSIESHIRTRCYCLTLGLNQELRQQMRSILFTPSQDKIAFRPIEPVDSNLILLAMDCVELDFACIKSPAILITFNRSKIGH